MCCVIPRCDQGYVLLFSSGFTAALNSCRSLAVSGLVLLRLGRLRSGPQPEPQRRVLALGPEPQRLAQGLELL